MTALAPDHLHILALARQSFKARDDKRMWSMGVELAIETHGAACEALWVELERQVWAAEGKIPVLEPPAVKARKAAKRMRSDILAAVHDAVVEALDNFPFDRDEAAE